jgi:branched-chain amino acid transport system substrate-binding protein
MRRPVTRKTYLSIVSAALGLLVIAGIAFQYRSKTVVASNEYHVGVVVPLTGSYSEWGQYMKEGVQLAQRRIAAQNSGLRLAVEIEDGRSSVKDALTAFNKIADQYRPLAVITMDSETVKALAPIATERDILLLATIAGGSSLFQEKQNGIRWYQNAGSIGSALANYSVRRGYKKISIVQENHVFADSVSEALTAALRKNGVALLKVEIFNSDAQTARDQAAKAIQGGPDAIVVTGTGGRPYVSAIRSLRELGWNGPILCDDSMNLPNVQRDVGEAAKGIVFVTSPFDPAAPSTARQREFVEDFRTQFARTPTDTAAYSYELLLMVSDLVASGASTAELLGKAFQAMRDRETVFGPVSYDGEHELSVPILLRIFTEKDGKLSAVPVN